MQVRKWTGREATALQAAMRMTNDAFAEKLGIAVRTVANWHKQPDLTPRSEMQQLLDTLLEQASTAEIARFRSQLDTSEPEAASEDAEALRAAIAIVTNAHEVLLVCRRTEDPAAPLSWQFPAGIVKPGASPATTAVREALAETGVTCRVRDNLGARIHPVTHVFCVYFLCDYLTGAADNRDPVENADVVWAPIDRLTRFIPAENIYPPVLEALERIGT